MTTTHALDTTILRDAADLLDRAGWTQGAEKAGDGSMCLTGAIRYCRPVSGDTYLIREVLRRREHAENWNDEEGRTKDDVTAYLRTTDITDADLADTFGPQWEPIVTFVRRAATLTEQEARDLAAARDAAWAAAWAAAWDAARLAARAAAWDAAVALVVRDLIGQHGFTQAHYDTLTGPWRTVIGQLHPDDTAPATVLL